ncbi:MAG: adenylate/guanylate cyclase domain-containing protein, partial [Alphaproteobacteria bacterium]|nr:adenylate/guanylate cyclase domain-containing protein [Alphaproteobacteria bacterium]
ALDIVDKMTETKKELNINVDVRIGIHTGPLVAGVIGTKKYAYDIWGDTVNVASRMESHGQPNKVHISADVREKLGDRFSLTKRGTIEIKNRGTIETWFVNGISSIGTSFNATKTGN